MAHIDPQEILEELKLTRVPSMELEEKCFSIITTATDSDEDYEMKEQAVLKLVENYSKHQNITKLKDLIIKIQPIVLNIQKSKTAKLLKSILDIMETVPNTIDIQIELCEFLISWCRKENRNFIRHKIELRLAHLLYEKGKYRESLAIAAALLAEARKLDDKNLLVEIQLVESRVYFAIKNYAKARASLTACRAAANAIYCNPLLQASIDNQAGVVNAQDKDFKTAYSYFFESFEVYHQNNKTVEALRNFQYMTLCKILMNATEEVLGLINGKYGIKYLGKELEFLKRVAGAHKKKNLVEFQKIIDSSQEVINQDSIIQAHVQDLYENLLELNLLKAIKPYSKVQLSHIAQQMNLESRIVQEKLSEMIIDRKINGTLDQGINCLIVFDEVEQGELYSSATHVLSNMDVVVDKLFLKLDQLKAIS